LELLNLKIKMKVAIYTRVSTQDQTNENQLIELRRFCQNNNHEVVAEFSDTISGTKSSRPELDKMMQAMREKQFEAVIVWKFDRLGRSTKHLLQVIEEMKNKNVGLIATSQNIDTSTSMGKFFFTILAGFAEMEREIIVERTMLGLSRAKSEGKKLGRPSGSKDSKRRRLSGYNLRWQKEPALN
jgi:DNA invertase Pin-like site-specific DNA recombinase